MQISDFVANISSMGGLARTNRFSVLVNPPSYALKELNSTGSSIILRSVLMFCDTVQLPGVSLNTAQTRTFGEVREVPYETNYEPITISFYVDNNFLVKQIFDAWILGIQDWNTRKFKYYKDYTTDFTLYVQDTEDSGKYAVKLFEAYPKTVSAISMSYDSKEVMKINVALMYKYWRSYTKSELIQSTNASGTEVLFPQTTGTTGWTQTAAEQWYQDSLITPEGMSEYTGEVFIDP